MIVVPAARSSPTRLVGGAPDSHVSGARNLLMSAGSPKAPCEPNATTRTIRLPTLSKRIVPPFTPAGGNIALRPARHRTDKPRAVLPQSIGNPEQIQFQRLILASTALVRHSENSVPAACPAGT